MSARVIKLAISAIVAAIDAISSTIKRLLGSTPPGSCVVIYYHAIRAPLCSRFAKQMDVLKCLTKPVDIENPGAFLAGKRYSAVTFDDGFMSVVENALPELRARNIPCLIFFPSASVGMHPIWIRPPHEDAGELVAPASVVRDLAQDPLVRIGSHSMSHPNFRRLEDDQAILQFLGSKERLEQLTGKEVTAFSFPHGAFSSRSIALARQCGYRRIYTIEPLMLHDSQEGVVGRVRVEPYDWPIEFRLKILGAYRWMVHVSAFKCWMRAAFKAGAPELTKGA